MLSVAALTAALLSTSVLAAPAIEARSDISCTGQPNLLANLYIFGDSAAHSIVSADGQLLGTDPVRDATAHPLLQSYNGNGVEQFVRHYQYIDQITPNLMRVLADFLQLRKHVYELYYSGIRRWR